jgi:hypothetical protein
VGHFGEGSSVTNGQKRVAFRIAGHVALALGVFSAYETHSGWGALALVLGIAAMALAVAEVMNRSDKRATADMEEFRRNLALIRAAAAGIKPKPPGAECIREVLGPMERP